MFPNGALLYSLHRKSGLLGSQGTYDWFQGAFFAGFTVHISVYVRVCVCMIAHMHM